MSEQQLCRLTGHRKVEVEPDVYVWMHRGRVNLFDLLDIIWRGNKKARSEAKTYIREMKNPRKRYFDSVFINFFEEHRYMAAREKVPAVLMLAASTEKLKKDVEKFLEGTLWRLMIRRESEDNKEFEQVDKVHMAVMFVADMLERMDSKDLLYEEYSDIEEVADQILAYAETHNK